VRKSERRDREKHKGGNEAPQTQDTKLDGIEGLPNVNYATVRCTRIRKSLQFAGHVEHFTRTTADVEKRDQ